MIKLTPQEQQALHMVHGSRQEFYKLELLDKYGVKKCDLELIDGRIDVDMNSAIQRAGSLTFRLPFVFRKVETSPPNEMPILASSTGKLFEVGIGIDGLIYTLEVEKGETTISSIKVQDNGLLYTEDTTVSSIEFTLIDQNGYTWEIGIEGGLIYSQRTDAEQKIYYRDEKIEINFLSDRVKAYMGVKIDSSIKWWPLGVYMMVKPVVQDSTVISQIYDECIIIQQSFILEPKLFLKGTNYIEVLRYLLISCGITKINIAPTTCVLQTDLILDDTKNNLDWFNYVAEQINYTKLSVNSDGWFISKKYVEPSPANVGYIYNENQLSVITGESTSTMDYWQIPNIFKRTVSHPQLGELTSIYINNDPTDPFSATNRHKIVDKQTVDNVAGQIELDNLTRKAAFQAKQITQEVSFNTANMPHHEVSDILDIRKHDLTGIFVEQGYSIQLKAGATMTHRVKRLVNLIEYS